MFLKLQSLGWSNDASIQQPGQISLQNKLQYSISHCPVIGGFICLSPKSRQRIGLDLEDPNRVNEKNMGRISSAEELEKAPDPASLWVAKEAFYKSLPLELQPLIISQTEITKWVRLKRNMYTFWGNQKETQLFSNSKGVVIAYEGLKIGLCIFYSIFS